MSTTDPNTLPNADAAGAARMQARTIRLVAVDLDGTLLNDAKQVSEQTATALAQLPKRGVPLVIASARPPRSIRRIYSLLNLDTLQINYNGAMIWDEPRHETIFHQPLAAQLVRQIAEFARDWYEEVLVSCEILDRWYTDRVDDALTTETGRLFKPDVIAPMEDFCSLDATKLLLLAKPAIIARLEAELIARFGSVASILQTDDHLLQIMNPAAGKAMALQKVAAHYGVPLAEVMAIGDAPNDVGMLQVAGVGVAMGNAYAVTKEASDWIAPSNNDNGVYAALRRYGLLDQPGG